MNLAAIVQTPSRGAAERGPYWGRQGAAESLSSLPTSTLAASIWSADSGSSRRNFRVVFITSWWLVQCSAGALRALLALHPRKRQEECVCTAFSAFGRKTVTNIWRPSSVTFLFSSCESRFSSSSSSWTSCSIWLRQNLLAVVQACQKNSVSLNSKIIKVYSRAMLHTGLYQTTVWRFTIFTHQFSHQEMLCLESAIIIHHHHFPKPVKIKKILCYFLQLLHVCKKAVI